MANKETKELIVGAATVTKSVLQTAEDNKFDFTDLAFFFDDFDEIEAAVKDLKLAPKEWPTMTAEEKEEMFVKAEEIIGGQMNFEDRADVVDIAQGLFAMIRLVSRKRNKPDIAA